MKERIDYLNNCFQIALKFSHPFWRSKVGEADFFGRVASRREARGMFGVFYDLSPKVGKADGSTKCQAPDESSETSQVPAATLKKDTNCTPTSAAAATPPSQATPPLTTNKSIVHSVASPSLTSSPLLHSISATSAKPPTPPSQDSPSLEQGGEGREYILVTTVSGEALNEYQKLSDKDIISKCMTCLRGMFPEEDVPAPSGHVVSRWGADPFAQMSYSYAAVGSSGEDYDHMAQDVVGKIFFAGEVRLTSCSGRLGVMGLCLSVGYKSPTSTDRDRGLSEWTTRS